MKKTLLLFLLATCSLHSTAQREDKQLKVGLQQIMANFHGSVGVYVKNLRTGKVVMINADTVFPTASIVKIPIFTGILSKMQTGELNYDSEFVYKDSLYYSGSDILGSYKANEKIPLKKLIMLMLTTSDNTASLWLQGLAGGGARINEILDSMGLKDTRVNSRTPGREGNRTIYGWGQTTPREMGMILEKMYRNEIFTPELCERMMRCLGRNYWDENEAISRIPPTIEVFSKNGCVNASRSEVMLVNVPRNPYIFCIFTKNNEDQRWVHENEAWAVARLMSAYLLNNFYHKGH
ncbi:MAG: serine hydrolase [Chitinophagaceae bacterium]|nr:serine hydrolase [Chitinophagaceae bacterium]